MTPGKPSASSSQSPPKEDTGDAHSELDVQETDQTHYTRAVTRRLPPPPTDQIRARKLLIHSIDRRPHLSPTSQNTILKQTTTSRVEPPVPPAQPSPSGIIPLGPPPPRQPGGPSSSSTPMPPPPPPAVGRFDHLPPLSPSYDDAWNILKELLTELRKLKYVYFRGLDVNRKRMISC